MSKASSSGIPKLPAKDESRKASSSQEGHGRKNAAAHLPGKPIRLLRLYEPTKATTIQLPHDRKNDVERLSGKPIRWLRLPR